MYLTDPRLAGYLASGPSEEIVNLGPPPLSLHDEQRIRHDVDAAVRAAMDSSPMQAAVRAAGSGIPTAPASDTPARARAASPTTPSRRASGSTFTAADVEAARLRSAAGPVTPPSAAAAAAAAAAGNSGQFDRRSVSSASSPHEGSPLPVRMSPADINVPVPISLSGPATPRGPFAPPVAAADPRASRSELARNESPREYHKRAAGTPTRRGASGSSAPRSPAATAALPPATPSDRMRAQLQQTIAKAVDAAVRAEVEHARHANADAMRNMAKQYNGYTNIKSAAVALFAASSFAQSLILALKLSNASNVSLAALGVTQRTERTLRELLGANLFFSALALLATLVLLCVSSARPDSAFARNDRSRKAEVRRKLGLNDDEQLGWLCKTLNAASMVFAFAVAVTATSIATFYTSPALAT